MLSDPDFKFLIQHTNLVAIDLVIRVGDQYLLGKRTNSPAKGYWFVPGGRVFKDEPLKDALHRILLDEVGIKPGQFSYEPIGVFDHIYPNENKYEETGYGTHYVVTALLIKPNVSVTFITDSQHLALKFMTESELVKDNLVHPLVKAYFEKEPKNCLFKLV